MLNHLRNSESGKIGSKSLKSGEIAISPLIERVYSQEIKIQFSCQVSTTYWLYQIKCNSLFTKSISLLSSLHIHCSRSEIPKLKSQNSKSSLRIPEWLSLLISFSQPTINLHNSPRPSSFLFFHHRRPTSSFSQPPWELESTQQQWRLSSFHQVSYFVYLVSPLAKIHWFSLLCR